MKRQIVSCGIFAMLLLASCNGAQQTSEVDLIDIAGGMEKLTELKVSDLGKTIRYIPLETTDSCLIGDFPNIKLLDDKIMVYKAVGSGANRMQDVDIYLNYIGRFVVPEVVVELTEEEKLAEAKRQEKLEKKRASNRKYMARKREEARKAWAEIEAEKAKVVGH